MTLSSKQIRATIHKGLFFSVDLTKHLEHLTPKEKRYLFNTFVNLLTFNIRRIISYYDRKKPKGNFNNNVRVFNLDFGFKITKHFSTDGTALVILTIPL